jgi:Bacterial Ig domain
VDGRTAAPATNRAPTATSPPPPTATRTPTATPPPPGDTLPPTVGITSPADGSQVRRNDTVTITASVSDNVGVARVEFSVNGVLRCTDTAPPYTCAWRVPNSAGVTQTLTAKAYDGAGNAASDTRRVTVVR